MTVTATFIRQLDREDFPVDARLYRLSEPVRYRCWDDGEETIRKVVYVVVSGSRMVALRQPETYIFPADETGAIIDWMELPGSFQGSVDHEKALRDAGFTVEHEPKAACREVSMTTDQQNEIEWRLYRVYQRMAPLSQSIRYATRNADRLSLANEIDSLRLELDYIRSLVKGEEG